MKKLIQTIKGAKIKSPNIFSVLFEGFYSIDIRFDLTKKTMKTHGAMQCVMRIRQDWTGIKWMAPQYVCVGLLDVEK